MQRAGIGVLAVLWMVQSTYADNNLSIFCREVVEIPGSYYTFYQLVLGINNTGAPHDLLGWQWKCEIRHEPDASGVCFDFNDDFTEGAFSQPENYVFGEMVLAATGDDCSDEMLTVSDQIFAPEPVSVPAEGTNLLQINLRASLEASGQFDIVVIEDGETGSGWFYECEFEDLQSFDLPPSGVIKSLFIPEPSTIALFFSAIPIVVVSLGWHCGRDAIHFIINKCLIGGW